MVVWFEVLYTAVESLGLVHVWLKPQASVQVHQAFGLFGRDLLGRKLRAVPLGQDVCRDGLIQGIERGHCVLDALF